MLNKMKSILGDELFAKIQDPHSRQKLIKNIVDFKSSLVKKIKEQNYEYEDLAFLYRNHYNMESKGAGANIMNLLKDVDIRTAFNKFFKKPENFEPAMKDIMYLIGHCCEQIEYLGGGSIVTSKYLIAEKKKYSQIVIDFLQKSESKKFDIDGYNDYIESVGGLDYIIMAIDYCDGLECFERPELLELAKQHVDKARTKRGMIMFADVISGKKSLSDLSKYENEDVMLVHYLNPIETCVLFDMVKNRNQDLDENQKFKTYANLIAFFDKSLGEDLVKRLKDYIDADIKFAYVKRSLYNRLKEKYSYINFDDTNHSVDDEGPKIGGK